MPVHVLEGYFLQSKKHARTMVYQSNMPDWNIMKVYYEEIFAIYLKMRGEIHPLAAL